MTTLKVKQSKHHSYTVINDLLEGDQIFPTVHMEISEQSSISDHLYAFERFLQAIGFSVPNGTHLDFVENETADGE